MKTEPRENWYQCYLAKWSVYELLEKCDADLAEKCQQAGCLKCGGRLDRSDYKRKPRGGPEEAKKVETWRDSFCCDREGCRKRIPAGATSCKPTTWQREYNRKVHSETDQTPLQRYLNDKDVGRPCPDTAQLRLAFTAEVTRTQRRRNPGEYEELLLKHALPWYSIS